MDFEIEKVIGYLVAAGAGSVLAYFQKMRRDITSAHKKIRKLQHNLGLSEDGECLNNQKKTSN